MRKYFLLLSFLFTHVCFAQSVINGSFEYLFAKTNKPVAWIFSSDLPTAKLFTVQLDSVVKQHGKYSVAIEKNADGVGQGKVSYATTRIYEGQKLELRGYIKTENLVGESSAYIFLRLYGERNRRLAFNEQVGMVKGTTDWKQYSIELPNRSDLKLMEFGGILTGGGKAWFDNFELYIDGVPAENAKVVAVKKAALDTSFAKGSNIENIAITPQQLINLSMAGQFWGFIKYHHPSVTTGDYNWDAELFRFLPNVLKAKTNQELSSVLENYLSSLPVPALCSACKENSDAFMKADYGDLFTDKILSSSLKDKLIYIKNNRSLGENYWVGKSIAGYANFKNEKPYLAMVYPDAGYRLLGLYRYWAMINYFYPHRNSIGKDWNKVLKESIVDFTSAIDQQTYIIAAMKLIAKIDDSHATISGVQAIEAFKGKYVAPIEGKFVEDKLVVTGFYTDTLGVKDKIKLGDVIIAINGKKIPELLKMYLPLISAANLETRLRDVPGNYLLRSNNLTMKLGIQRENKVISYEIPTVAIKYMAKKPGYNRTNGYYLINNEVGYVYPAKYKNTDLPAIKKEFENTKGIIVDMRSYPGDSMPYTFGSYIKNVETPFFKSAEVDLSNPGSFSYTNPVNSGNKTGDGYKGKIVLIVDANTQSQGEFTTMSFQGSPNVMVIGSKSAGSAGNITNIFLPGGIDTRITALAIYYPDGSPTQIVGVKINQQIKPTIKGIAAGRDELLEKAIALIK